MSESKKKVKVERVRDAQGRFTQNRNFPEPLYDVTCAMIQDALHIYGFARLHTEYTPCLTSTIAPPRLSLILGQLACVCTRFRDVLRCFRAKNVEFIAINYDLRSDLQYVVDYASILLMENDFEWELMFQEQKIYRLGVCLSNGWFTLLAMSQNCNSKVYRRITVEKAAIEAMTMDERDSKRDEILNWLMEDLETWPTLSPLT